MNRNLSATHISGALPRQAPHDRLLGVEDELSFAASFTPFGFLDATITWTSTEIVFHGIATHPMFGELGEAIVRPSDVRDVIRVPIAKMTSLTLRQPWPAFEVLWDENGRPHRLLAHPRGLARLVPATPEAREAFTHFATLVERMVADIARVAADRVRLDRGWLESEPVTWTRRVALPPREATKDGYRQRAHVDTLLGHALIQRPFWTRVRLALGRWGRRAGRDPFPVELAISEREVAIVDDRGVIWAVPRRALRAVYADDERIALIIGRDAFLAMSMARSPLRDELVAVARRAIAQDQALRELDGPPAD